MKKNTIPKGLQGESAAFYRRICETHELTDAGMELLRVAAFTLQRWAQAKDFLDENGLVQQGSLMNHVHPMTKVEHDSRLSFCRLLKELNIDSSDEVKNELKK